MYTTFDCIPADSLSVYLPTVFILVVAAIGEFVMYTTYQSRDPDAKRYAIFRINQPNFRSRFGERGHPIFKYLTIFIGTVMSISVLCSFHVEQFELAHGYYPSCKSVTVAYYIVLNFGITSVALFVRNYLMSDERKFELEHCIDIDWYMQQYDTYTSRKGQKLDGVFLTESSVKWIELFEKTIY